MMRRRALLAASMPSGGGGKIINYGHLTLEDISPDPPFLGEYFLTFDYPVDSRMLIRIGSLNFFFNVGAVTSFAAGNEGAHIGDVIFYDDDQQYSQSYEDDTYIYQIIIEV